MKEFTSDDVPYLMWVGALLRVLVGIAKAWLVMLGAGVAHSSAPSVPALGFYEALVLLFIFTVVKQFKVELEVLKRE